MRDQPRFAFPEPPPFPPGLFSQMERTLQLPSAATGTRDTPSPARGARTPARAERRGGTGPSRGVAAAPAGAGGAHLDDTGPRRRRSGRVLQPHLLLPEEPAAPGRQVPEDASMKAARRRFPHEPVWPRCPAAPRAPRQQTQAKSGGRSQEPEGFPGQALFPRCPATRLCSGRPAGPGAPAACSATCWGFGEGLCAVGSPGLLSTRPSFAL